MNAVFWHGPLIGVLAACLAACSTFDGPHGSQPADALTTRVDAFVAPLVAANEFSGAIVLERDGRAVYARGLGLANHTAGLAFTPDTPADGGSLAKTFTAAGIWWLASEGKVDLDANVRRYVPEYPHSRTTVGQLLSHSNGLPADYEFFDAHFGKDDVRTTPAMLKIVGRQAPRPSFEPGTRYEYSNLGYDAAALVIERVTGQSYEAFVKKRFFSRLGLASSFARPARLADWRGVRPVGYRWRDGAWQPNDAGDGEGFLGASNLYFSAADLARWGSANAAGAALPGPVFESGQGQFRVAGRPLHVTGLSWHCDDRKVRCNYTGHHSGFHSFVFWDRERNESVAFVSNSTLPAWKIVSLQRELVNALAGKPPDADPPEAFIETYEIDPAEIAGTYVAPGTPPISVVAVQGGPRVRFGDGLEFDAYPAAKQVLYVPGLDCFLAFSGSKAARTLHIKSQELNLRARRENSP